jgi:hypothetical protein
MDEDAKSGKAFVERVANRIALNMARLGTVRDGETQDEAVARLQKEILARRTFTSRRKRRWSRLCKTSNRTINCEKIENYIDLSKIIHKIIQNANFV